MEQSDLDSVGGSVNCCNLFGKLISSYYLLEQNTGVLHDQTILVHGIHLKEIHMFVQNIYMEKIF